MLATGHPPDDWAQLPAQAQAYPRNAINNTPG